MKIIADPEMAGVGTKCLAINWGLPDICQIDNCNNKTYAIVSLTESETPEGHNSLTFVICKEHYKEAKATSVLKHKVNFPAR